MISTVMQDLRLAVRSLRRAPGVALLAVACMGLGIGTVTAMYGTANAFTFRPLPQVRDAGRVMVVWEAPAAEPWRAMTLSPPALEELRGLGVFDGAAAAAMWEANIAGVDLAERVVGARVSAGFLTTLGRVPALGRDFTVAEQEAGNDRVTLLTYGLWQRRFGADTAIVGRTVRINGESYVVAGILPRDFVFPSGAELLVPLGLSPATRADRVDRSFMAMAHRAPGVTRAQARAAVAALGARLATAHPESNADWVMMAENAEAIFGSGPRPFMWVLLASSAFVLLIACANVANLLLVRATGRRREIALRVALGASGGRIVRQLLTESVVIAAPGAVLGVLCALWGLEAIAASVPSEIRAIIPGFGQLRLDGRALGVTGLVALGAGVLAGLAPALAATRGRGDLQAVLKDGGRGDTGASRTGRIRSALVVAEVALALVLLTGATLETVTFRKLLYGDPGFRADGVLTLGVTLPPADYPDAGSRAAFAERLEDRLVALPGVLGVGATTVLPMAWQESRIDVALEGRPPRRPDEAPRLGFRCVSAGYLPAIGVAIRRGRGFSSHDDSIAPAVAVVSEAAARKLWPGEDPLGRRVVMRERLVEVVGIAGNVRGNVLMTEDPLPVAYVPLAQWPTLSPTFVLRSAGDPVALAGAARREIATLDPRLAAGDVLGLPRVMLGAVSPQRATAQILAAAAVVALLMAVIGTYGVLAYSVAQRTQEIGVRVALGATAGDVLRLVLRSAMSLAGWGIAIGVLGSLAMGRGMRAILYDTDAADPVVLAASAAAIGVAAFLAGLMPARRATRVDPMAALRYEGRPTGPLALRVWRPTILARPDASDRLMRRESRTPSAFGTPRPASGHRRSAGPAERRP